MTNKLDEVQHLLEERAARVLTENNDEEAILAAAAKIKARRDEQAAILRAAEKERKAIEEANARAAAERKRLDDAEAAFTSLYASIMEEGGKATQVFYGHRTQYEDDWGRMQNGDPYFATTIAEDEYGNLVGVEEWLNMLVANNPGFVVRVRAEILKQPARDVREALLQKPYCNG